MASKRAKGERGDDANTTTTCTVCASLAVPGKPVCRRFFTESGTVDQSTRALRLMGGSDVDWDALSSSLNTEMRECSACKEMLHLGCSSTVPFDACGLETYVCNKPACLERVFSQGVEQFTFEQGMRFQHSMGLPALEVKPSNVHNDGLFNGSVDIHKGDVIWVPYCSVAVPAEALENIETLPCGREPQDSFIYDNHGRAFGDAIVFAPSAQPFYVYINHGSGSTANVVPKVVSGELTYVASKRIGAGAELFYDYGREFEKKLKVAKREAAKRQAEAAEREMQRSGSPEAQRAVLVHTHTEHRLLHKPGPRINPREDCT